MDVDVVARELYGLPPEEFIDVRNARSKGARSAGDKGVAREVQAMRKPTTAAWLVNQLIRHHHDEMRLLLDLGAELRAGMAGVGAEELRLLTRRRYQLVSTLVEQARATAGESGRRVSADVLGAVRTTLEATLADADSAGLVAAGCLADALEVSGFGFGIPATESPALDPDIAVDTSSPVADLDERRRLRDEQVRQAAADVTSAQAVALEARRDLDDSQVQMSQLDEGRSEAEATVQRLTQELARATSDLDETTGAAQEQAGLHAAAAAALRRADRELADAEARMRKLQR